MASNACWFQEPAVSMAIGMNTRVAVRSAYLAVFEFTALLAADPAWAEVASMCESATVGFPPLDHGSNFTPLCLLLSLVVRPRGSFVYRRNLSLLLLLLLLLLAVRPI